MSIAKTLTLAVLTVGLATTGADSASAADLDGTYRIREGDETVRLDHMITDPASGLDVYSLSCTGIFASSSGRLVHDPAAGKVWVKVTPIRNPFNLALQGEGEGTVGSGRTIVVNGLKLDNMLKQLHFD